MSKKINLLLLSFLVLPFSNNYKLEGFSFGNAGGASVGSSNYGIVGEMGEFSNDKVGSSNYDLGAGLAFIRQSAVPKAPTLVNDGNFYNKLLLTLDDSTTMTPDTKFAVAISKDNWVTTQFVKSDMTVGSSLTLADYATYTLSGGASGRYIIGLDIGTTYAVKVKSMQGQYSESGYGTPAIAGTVSPTLSFDIDISPSDTQTTPPYLISFGDLISGSVSTSSDKIWISFDTNANSGGSVFLYGQNGGLYSLSVGYTIPGVAGNLAVLSNGFGAQSSSVTQVSGGPLVVDVGYTGSGDSVGIIDKSVRQILVATAPVTTGRASLVVKSKSDINTPSASDYTETVTIVAAANY